MDAVQLDMAAPIQPRMAGSTIPLTAAQRRVWNISVSPNGLRLSLRLCASAVRILGPLDSTLLSKSLALVVSRHEALRSRIISIDGIPRLHIEDINDYALSIFDLSNLSLPEARQEALRLAQEFIDRRIDLSTELFFEARAWKLRDDEYVLVLLIDHMVSDGTSNGILTRELWSLYDLAARGESPVLPKPAVQFGDYAVWQARTYSAWMREHSAYWREHLSGVQPTVLPTDGTLSEPEGAVGTTVHIPFGNELTASLRAAARREGTLLSVLVLVAYSVVTSHWCRQEDILLSFPSHERQRPILRNVVGLIAGVLPLRIQVLNGQTLRELLMQVKSELSSALRHRDFDRVPDFIPECVSEVSFNWQTTHSERGALDHHTVLECADAFIRSVPQDTERDGEQPQVNKLRILSLPARTPHNLKFASVIFDTPDGLHMAVAFRPDLLKQSTIERFGRNLLSVAEQLAERPSTTIASAMSELQ